VLIVIWMLNLKSLLSSVDSISQPMEITVDDLAVEESFSKDLILLFQECENEIPHPPSVPRKLASLSY